MRRLLKSSLWLCLHLSLAPLTFFICFWCWLIFKLRPKFNKRSLQRPVVVILGGKQPQVLHICRLFSAAGFKVVVCSTDKPLVTCSAWSVHCNTYCKLPNPSSEPDAYMSKVCTAVVNHKASIIIPTEKQHSSLDAQIINELGDSVISMAFDATSFQELDDKIAFFDSLDKRCVPCSECYIITQPSQVREVILKPGRTKTFVLKPAYKSPLVNLPRGIIVPSSSEQELNQFLESRPIGQSFPFLLQEQMHTRTPIFDSCSLVVNGRVIAHTSMARFARYQTINHQENSDIENWIENFVKCYPRVLTGWVSFAFMRSMTDGHWYPISCQPRLSFQFLLYMESDMVIKELLQKLHPQNHVDESEIVTIHQRLRRKLPIKPRTKHVFWIFSQLYQGLTCQEKPCAMAKKIVNVIYGHEAMFRFTDPMPFFTYNCLYLPSVIVRNIFVERRNWSNIDFSLGILK